MIGFLWSWLRRASDRALPRHLRDARHGEDLAYRFLRDRGYRIVARNFRQRGGRGELDLIGWDGEQLACIEVKTRKNADFGAPEEFVGREKRRLAVSAAHEYARRAGIEPQLLRYDIVGVTLEPQPRLELYKDAFSERRERAR